MIFFNDSFVAPVRLKSIDVILFFTVGFMVLLNSKKKLFPTIDNLFHVYLLQEFKNTQEILPSVWTGLALFERFEQFQALIFSFWVAQKNHHEISMITYFAIHASNRYEKIVKYDFLMTPKTYRVHLFTKVLICSSFKNFNSSKFNFSTAVVRLLTKKSTESSESSVFLRLISFNATHLLQIRWIDSKLRIGYCSQILDSG